MNNNYEFLNSEAGKAWMRVIATKGHPQAVADFVAEMNMRERRQKEEDAREL